MEWLKTESTEYPNTVDITSSATTVYVRRKIKTEVRDEVTYYTYEECKMTKEQYQLYANVESSKDNDAIMEALIEINGRLEALENG